MKRERNRTFGALYFFFLMVSWFSLSLSLTYHEILLSRSSTNVRKTRSRKSVDEKKKIEKGNKGAQREDYSIVSVEYLPLEFTRSIDRSTVLPRTTLSNQSRKKISKPNAKKLPKPPFPSTFHQPPPLPP